LGGVTYRDHNDRAVIVDKHGEIAGMFNATSTIESKKGLEIVKRCLAEEYDPTGDVAPEEKAETTPGEKSEAPPAANADEPAAVAAEAA
jgi:hypothetical protein